MPRRYAEGTDVPVDRSRGEITGILAAHGVERMGWHTGPEGDELLFEIEGGQYRFSIRKPSLDDVKDQARLDGKDLRYIPDWNAKVAGEWRRRWRAHVLLLKAKLEFIDGGDTTVTRELLPYRVLKGGQTLEEAILAGGLPQLTAGAGR
jgi:hypothetical protein